MNNELFIARKVFFNKDNRKNITNRIVSIAIASISIGLAIMIVSVAVLLGFKNEVREKISGFGGHIHVINYDSNNSEETTTPIQATPTLLKSLNELEGITSSYPYATKPGMIITNNEMHAMVFKGVEQQYDWQFFQSHLTEGTIPEINDLKKQTEVIVSLKMAQALKLSVGDAIFSYFYNENSTIPQNKKFTVSGIYQTTLEEFDELFIIGDIKQVQSMNKWDSDQVSGIELMVENFNDLDYLSYVINDLLLEEAGEDQFLRVTNIKRLYPQHFDWLHLLDMNVWVILTIMIIVSGFNMISGLLILILERTQMIGILKALGSPNISIRKVFLYLSAFLIGKGLLWGNIIGIGICLIQHFTGIITLNPETYYLDTVPILLKMPHLLLLNMCTLTATVIMLILPSNLIARISPDKAIRFE